MCGPAARVERCFCFILSDLADGVEPVCQRAKALGQVCLVHKPVVHLDIHIRAIVAAPGRPVALVPDPLQVPGRELLIMR